MVHLSPIPALAVSGKERLAVLAYAGPVAGNLLQGFDESSLPGGILLPQPGHRFFSRR
ncbi:hypothetical protein [Methanoculleus taiwanensis]|uniref:hypothetical protein n=1 Tax=Methanoculleus taiwanensis TaxID=1550565 RepID=UPI0013E8EB91|nr:hypothetical protein [Methanoculleus taiwanensis]